MHLVVAFGNTLRGDDGVAWHVASQLESEVLPAEVITVHQLTPELAAVISEAEGVIFVDAAATGAPGDVRCVPLGAAPTTAPVGHHLRPEALLAYAYALYGSAPRVAALVSVAGADFGLKQGLSLATQRAVPLAARQIRELLAQWLGDDDTLVCHA